MHPSRPVTPPCHFQPPGSSLPSWVTACVYGFILSTASAHCGIPARATLNQQPASAAAMRTAGGRQRRCVAFGSTSVTDYRRCSRHRRAARHTTCACPWATRPGTARQSLRSSVSAGQS
eukprot:4935578-Prymnesium_polylepis.2